MNLGTLTGSATRTLSTAAGTPNDNDTKDGNIRTTPTITATTTPGCAEHPMAKTHIHINFPVGVTAATKKCPNAGNVATGTVPENFTIKWYDTATTSTAAAKCPSTNTSGSLPGSTAIKSTTAITDIATTSTSSTAVDIPTDAKAGN